MARRGMSEEILYALNPLPLVSEAELIERCGNLDMLEPSERGPFDIFWPYSFGVDRETVRIRAGQYIPLRSSETKDFIRLFADQGMVVVKDPNDKREVRAASLKGLRMALKFYDSRGKSMLAKFRKQIGVSKEELDKDYAGDLWPYFLNAAKAEVIKEAIDALTKQKDEAGPALPADKPTPATTRKR